MKKIETLDMLNELYDEVYLMYKKVNVEWNEAFEKDSYKEMREASCKRGAYLDVMNLLVAKMKEA